MSTAARRLQTAVAPFISPLVPNIRINGQGLYIEVNITNTTKFQDLVQDEFTGEWYGSRAVNNSIDPTYEDTWIYRFTPDGQTVISIAVMTLFGHGSTIALERDNALNLYVWLPRREYGADGLPFDDHMYRFHYAPGTYEYSDPRCEDVNLFTTRFQLVSIDAQNDRIAMRTVDKDRNDIFIQRRFSDIKKGINIVLHQFQIGPSTSNRQCFCTIRDNVYILDGATNEITTMFQYSFITGKLLASLTYTAGLINGETSGSREPEALSWNNDALLVGIRMFNGVPRRLRMFAIAPLPNPYKVVSLSAIQNALLSGTNPGTNGIGDNDGEQVQRALNQYVPDTLIIDGVLGAATRASAAKAQGKYFNVSPVYPAAGYHPKADGILRYEEMTTGLQFSVRE